MTGSRALRSGAQTRTVPSFDAVTTLVPSPLNAALNTQSS